MSELPPLFDRGAVTFYPLSHTEVRVSALLDEREREGEREGEREIERERGGGGRERERERER